ncbi:MAG: MFS transporter [Rhodobacteraceae bacterium]|nr:MFS transporter [Paracoccaceae bacterium]
MSGANRAAALRVLLIWVAGLTAAGEFAKISVIFPDLAAIYPEAGARLGFLLSLISLMGVIFGLGAGLAVARLGGRRQLLGALALGALVSAFQATLPAFPLMLASRVVEGMAHLAIVVAAPTLIAEIAAPRFRGLALSLWSTFFAVAYALAGLLGPPLAAAQGPAAVLAVHGALMAGCALALAAALPARTGAAPVPPAFSLLSPAALWRSHAAVYGDPGAAAPAAGWFFYTLAFVSLLTVLPATLDPAERLRAATVMPLGAIAVSMILGVTLMRRIPAVRVVMLGFASALVLSFGLAAAPGSALPAIVLFAALGLVQGPSFAAVAQLNPDPAARARANGALAQTGNLGNLLGTPLLLAMIETMGDAGIVVFAAGAFAAGLATHFAFALRRRAAADMQG